MRLSKIRLSKIRLSPPQILILVFFGMGGVVGSALVFEHWGGYVPCALCLTQRIPYYIGIGIALFGIGCHIIIGSEIIVRLCLWAILLALLTTATMGIYHSGVEWGFWQGPASCDVAGTGTGASDASTLLSELATTKPPSCNEAAGRFLFLSFAGWNVVVAILLFALTLRGIVFSHYKT